MTRTASGASRATTSASRRRDLSDRADPLLTASALVYLVAALPLLFAPRETLGFAGLVPTAAIVSLVQVISALLFGFAMLNWMNRRSRIGGIYGRPVVVANLSHTVIATATLARTVPGSSAPWPAWVAFALYALLVAAFAWKLFHTPRMTSE